MELIIQILMILILINCFIKLSFWKIWQISLIGIVSVVFILLVYPLATRQSKTQIEDFLNNSVMMQNMSVLVTIESGICFAFCFAALMELFGKKTHKPVLILYRYPGVLFFLVLFYGLTQSMFSFTGTDFFMIAVLYAAVISITLFLSSWLIKRIIPETDLRLEVHFIVSLVICILGLVTTVEGNVIYKASEESVNLRHLLLSLGIFLLFFILGFYGNKIKWKKTKTINNIKTN